MVEKSEGTDSEAGIEHALATVGDTLGDIITGIPAPIRKNALKAFARLCTAAVEYPVALIEDAIAEKHAASQARVKLINTSANQIAQQMQTDPEYARAAVKKFAHKIIREQVNVDRVSEIAAAELKSQPPPAADDKELEVAPISEDWLNVFENEASQLSSEQMQSLFGKILAGEIRRPATYSIKTVKLMGQLDNHAATLFKLLCSLSISLRVPASNVIVDARVVSMGNAGANSLLAYGLGFEPLNVLQEYGLIISDYNSYADYQAAIMHDGKTRLPITYEKSQWTFVPKTPRRMQQEFRVDGVSFSRSGKELLPIIDVKPNEQYTTALSDFFDKQGMTIEKIA